MRTLVPLPLLLLAACLSPRIVTDFEGASLGSVTSRSETEFECAVEGQADQDGRNRQASWYFFRLDNARGREVTVTLTDLRGEYNYRPGNLCITDESPPVVSRDGISWSHHHGIEFDKEGERLHLKLKPDVRRLWVAHIEPYTPSRLDRFLDSVRGRPHLEETVIGETVRGRPLRLLTITDPATPAGAKRTVWLMIRQHAWESGSSFVGEGAVRWMLSEDPEAVSYRQRVIFKVFPMMDPDGCAEGGVRFNRYGYDLNRNWDAVNMSSSDDRRRMPEIFAAKKAMFKWISAGEKIDLFLTVHNQERGEWISGSIVDPERAQAFFDLLRETTSFHPGRTTPRPPGDAPEPGRASVYQFMERTWGVPALLLEQGIARHPRLGRFPTSKDRLEFGRGLAQALCRSVLEE